MYPVYHEICLRCGERLSIFRRKCECSFEERFLPGPCYLNYLSVNLFGLSLQKQRCCEGGSCCFCVNFLIHIQSKFGYAKTAVLTKLSLGSRTVHNCFFINRPLSFLTLFETVPRCTLDLISPSASSKDLFSKNPPPLPPPQYFRQIRGNTRSERFARP